MSRITILDTFSANIAAGKETWIGHAFILYGNINDLQRNMKGDYVPLKQYLVNIFGQRDLIMFYSLSAGLNIIQGEDIFRSRYAGFKQAVTGNVGAATKKAQEMFGRKTHESKATAELIGESPLDVMRVLEKALADLGEGAPRSVLIVDFAHNLAPGLAGCQNPQDRAVAEILERLAQDDRVESAGNTLVLLSPTLAELSANLSAPQSGLIAIRIPKPDENTRISRWKHLVLQNGVKFEDGLTPEFLGRVTNGLSLKQIDSIYFEAKGRKNPVSLKLIKEKKQEILETEFGDRIRVKIPHWGFDHFGGKEHLKQYMFEIRDNIVNGVLRRAPMGMLASGPPGTGKTFFFECWAYECGFNFVEIANPRSKWVGESEAIIEKIFAALDDLAPVIVVEDEADQSETSRDSPNGDTGVSNRLRQMKFKFTSDPKRRGRVIWVRISNRADLIDAAYKREGRSDDTIPFLMPEPREYEDILRVMFKRYGIETEITDLAFFAEQIAAKNYCTGASVEWMVLEADKYAGREGRILVTVQDLQQAIDDWEMKLDPIEVDRQTILALQGSSKRLRPANWKEIICAAQERCGSPPGIGIPLKEKLASAGNPGRGSRKIEA